MAEMVDLSEAQDALDVMFDDHWNEAVDDFSADGEDEEAFQAALRNMVRSLQRRAYFAGANDAITDGLKQNPDDERLSLTLTDEDQRAVVRAMLYGYPLRINLNPA